MSKLCGAGKEKRACNFVSGIWISASKRIDSKCWLADMKLVMTSLPLARVSQCLFTFTLVFASRWLAKIWQLSRRGATKVLDCYSNSRNVVASSPSFFHPTARSPRKACSQANMKYQLIAYLNSITSELSNLLSPRNALFTFKEE